MSHPITWITPAGLIGVYPAGIAMQYKVEAITTGATITNYKIISGNLPNGLIFRDDGKISGTPATVSTDSSSTFVVRVTNSANEISDRTFSISISGVATPVITTPAGTIDSNLFDSTWFEFPILYTNPLPDNPVSFRVLQGLLPPGLEINEFGLIRGYADPPIKTVNLQEVNTIAVATDGNNNFITVLSTFGFRPNRPITFSGTSFGGIVPYNVQTNTGQIYYVKEVINATQITICLIPEGPVVVLNTDTGFMDVNLRQISVGDPTKIQYNFTIELSSPIGSDTASYTITVVNQTLAVSQGGPGYTVDTRIPTILNTRPPTYNIDANTSDYGYYVLPPAGFSKSISGNTVDMPGLTYDPNQDAYIGQFQSDTFFSFHVLGYDFDNVELTYQFLSKPVWLTANTSTGWIYGDPSISSDSIEEFSFQVRVYKTIGGIDYYSSVFNFIFKIANDIDGEIIWETPSNLGTFKNGSISYQDIVATSDVPLLYSLDFGSLPPNLELLTNGQIIGTIAYQPNTIFEEPNANTVFTFTANAYAQDANLANVIYSTKTFTMTVNQNNIEPTDNLYIKCTPNSEDRIIIASLLSNTYLIPDNYLYRSDDQNFGKATDVVYAHAFGIDSSNLEEYIEATQKNHYWRNITLGSLGTAVARDSEGNILYEVVFSNVIDNLMKYDPEYGVDYRFATSIDEEIFWPRFIDLNLGPWYVSSTDIYTSYIFAQDATIITDFREYNLLTQSGIPLILNQGVPLFNTNLSPGYARILYPNSLKNMRERVEQELGVSYDPDKLPLWMTSQQLDGNTLGFTPAWVIAYTKPPELIINTATQTISDLNAIVLSSKEGIVPGRQIIFTGNTFGNILSNQVYYVKSIVVPGYPTAITISKTKDGATYPLYSETGSMTATFNPGSYAEIIKERIENDWDFTLNQIDFKIDRFTVDKQITYDYNNFLQPNVWVEYPSATPEPDPADSQNFYVLFPQKTILPNKTQYNL
jgi:hypothetical protein